MGDPIIEKEDGWYYADPHHDFIAIGPYGSRDETEAMLELYLQSGITSE